MTDPSTTNSSTTNPSTTNDATNIWDQKVYWSRLISLIAYVAMIFTFLFTNFFLAEYPGSVRYILSAVQILPLLIFIPGLKQDSHRTHTWICFLMLFYFMVYTVEVMSPTRIITDSMIWTYTIVIFISSMMFIRWKKRQIAG